MSPLSGLKRAHASGGDLVSLRRAKALPEALQYLRLPTLFHQGKILPEVLQALRATEERGEIG
jgi:hypothetical protein